MIENRGQNSVFENFIVMQKIRAHKRQTINNCFLFFFLFLQNGRTLKSELANFPHCHINFPISYIHVYIKDLKYLQGALATWVEYMLPREWFVTLCNHSMHTVYRISEVCTVQRALRVFCTLIISSIKSSGENSKLWGSPPFFFVVF